MAKGYLSNRQKNLKIGISSYTENSTVLEVTGKVGIGTTNPQSALDVRGAITVGVGTVGINSISSTTDIQSWYYTNKSKSVTGDDTSPQAIYIGAAGTAMFLVGDSGNDVNQYTLSTPYDVSTAGASVGVFSVATQETNPLGIDFNSDGTKMFISGAVGVAPLIVGGEYVHEYSLSTAWTVSSAGYTTSYNVTQDTAPQGVTFGNSGSKMYVVGSTGDAVYQYSLSTPYSLASGVTYDNISLVLGTNPILLETAPIDISFNSAGTVLWVAGSANDRIYEFRLGTAWDISTAVFYDDVYIGFNEITVTGLHVIPEQNVAYIVGSNSDTVFQYSTNTPALEIASSGISSESSIILNNETRVKDKLYVKGLAHFDNSILTQSDHTVGGTVTAGNVTVSGNVTASGAVTFDTTTSNINLATSQTTGTLILGGTLQTGAITLGRATTSQTLNIATGVSAASTTKTVNIATGGASGSFTQINIGPTAGIGTVLVNTGTNLGIGSATPRAKLDVLGDARVSGAITATTFVGALTGTATTATALQNARNFSITGNFVTASAISFDGTDNVALAATITPDSIGLGTYTTGDYVKNISGTSNQITVTSGTGEGSTPTLSLPTNFVIPQDATVTRDLQVNRNLNVTGNITIGGTTATIFSQTLNIYDPDIVLGVRTDAFGNDISTDNTANHGGIAIASTEGSPLVNLFIAGIETNPSTYKKIMWFKGGTLGTGTTDAWLFNYAVGIGSTQVPNGVRLAAGAVQFTENDLAVVRNINASGVTTSSRLTLNGANDTATNGGQIYLNGATGNRIDFNTNGAAPPSFVSITQRSVGTKIILYPQAGASSVDYAFGIDSNTLWYSVPTTSQQHRFYAGTTQLADLKGTGELVIGSTNLTGTSNQRLQIGSSGTPYGAYISGSVGIGTTNPQSARLDVHGPVAFGTGTDYDSTFSSVLIRQRPAADGYASLSFYPANGNLVAKIDAINASNELVVWSNKNSSVGNRLNINMGTSEYISFSPRASEAMRIIQGGTVLIGAAISTGTTLQRLQVTGGAYISTSTGIGTTNPLQTLHVLGNVLVAAGTSTGQHITQKAYELNSGTLSWEGSAGQLFSITNNLTSGSIFSVNDVSGIPSIDVNADGTIQLAPYGTNERVGIGTTAPTAKLDVIGDVRVTGVSTFNGNVVIDNGTGNVLNLNNGTLFGVGNIIINDPGPDEGIQWNGGNGWRIYEAPDSLANSGGNLQFNLGSGRLFTMRTDGSLSVPGIVTSTGLNVSGIGTFDKLDVNQLSPDGVTFGQNTYVPVANGTGTWSWQPITQAGAGTLDGIVVREQGDIVGTAGSVTNLDFRGNNIIAISTTGGAIATITVSDTPTFLNLTVTPGISTLGVTTVTNLSAQQLNVSGLSTFTGIVTTTSDLYIGGTLYTSAGVSFPSFSATNLNVSGIATISVNTSTPALRITQVGSGNALLVEDDTNPDTTPFVVTGFGRVGIGQTNPNTALHIGPYNGNDLPHLYLASGNNLYGWRFDTQDFGGGSVPLRIWRRVNGIDTESVTILNQSGNLGIGVTNPTSKLDVFTSGGQNQIRSRTDATNNYSLFVLQNTGASGREYHFGLGGSAVGGVLAGSAYLYDATAGATRWYTDSSGNFIVGSSAATGTASQPLQVTGGAYISTRLGVGVTNPASNTQVSIAGTLGLDAVGGAGTRTLFTSTPAGFVLNHSDNSNIEFRVLNGTKLQYQYSPNFWSIPSGTPFLVGTGTSTGTASQPLQVNGGAYVSSHLGVGLTNPYSSGSANIEAAGTIVSRNNFAALSNGASQTNSGAFIRSSNGFSTPSTPNYTFWYNDTTGIYHPSANNIGITIAGTESVRFNSTGVGIGSTAPTERLDVVGNIKLTGAIYGPTELVIDPAAVGDNTGAVRIKGDLYVDGTQTYINSTTIELADFNVGIATTVGTNLLLDGAGIGIGSTNIRKTITWNNTASALTSSEDWNLVSGKQYEINGTSVLSSTTLGSGVVNSSLTSVGTLGQLNVSGVSTFTAANTSAVVVRSGSAGSYTAVDVGRTFTEGLFAVASTAGEFSANAVAGDVILRANTANSKLLFNIVGGNASLAVAGNNVLVGTVSSTGTASQALQVNSGAYVSGNLGVGITNPGQKLDVYGGGAQIRNPGGSSFLEIGNGQNSNQYAYIDLVGDTTYTDYGLRIIRGNTGANTPSDIVHRGLGDFRLITNEGAPITFYTTNTERVRINSSGSVGIGTTNPTSTLTNFGSFATGLTANTLIVTNDSDGIVRVGPSINSTGTSRINIQDRNGSYASFYVGTTLASRITAPNSTDFALEVGGTERLRVLGSNGNIGIGTTNPGYKLEVLGSFAATTKSFVIDHPTKPGKKLRYASLEGPENGVYVRGRTQSSIIELPDYWTGLVDETSITVNLTPIGESATPRVKEVMNNQVVVFTKEEGELDYYYTVFAERKDVEKLEVEI